MRVYLRKIFSHDETHEISTLKPILNSFFEFPQVNKDSKIKIKGKISNKEAEVQFQTPQDPRFGKGLKEVLSAEADDWRAEDIILFKKFSTYYLIEVIKKNDIRYDTLNEFFEKDRHCLIYLDDDNQKNIEDNIECRNPKGSNILFYGVAGVGKSHTINQMTNNDKQFIERVIFHPDYLNTDFIGQILPSMEDGKITYKFKAGTFTKILKKAINNPSYHYYLIIEEINRGNAPAIFGEIFQLLDRNSSGRSQYEISHDLIAHYVYGNENQMIYIPSNLSIYATMNAADQNVFTLDTAFQRRWIMKMIDNNIENCTYKNRVILDTGISWKAFNNTINEYILDVNKDGLSSEDKRLGAFFVREDELVDESYFAEKVIKYLWDDVFKFNKNALFNPESNSLDKVLHKFKTNKGFERFNIFNEDIKSLLENVKNNQESTATLESKSKNE